MDDTIKVRPWLQKCILISVGLVLCGNIFAGLNAELDVVFEEPGQQCRFMYILSPDIEGKSDTLAIFDSLAFNRQQRVSLFFPIPQKREIKVSILTAGGQRMESGLFGVSPRQTTFAVSVNSKRIKITGKDFLYPQKNEDERSYVIFSLIFFIVKMLISSVYISVTRLPKPLLAITSGIFILSAFIDWFFPMNYYCRFLFAALFETLLLKVAGRASITWRHTILLATIVNIIGFGIIFALYFMYVLW